MKHLPLIFAGLLISSSGALAAGSACDQAVPAAVKQHEQKLGKAFDKYRFCGSDHSNVSKCFTALVKAVIKLESGGNPKKFFKEPGGMKPSEGCLQMSKGECPEGSLSDPNANVQCGVRKMAELIDKGGAICKGKKEGACKYWSVLRPPYSAYGLSLGRQQRIIHLTKQNLQQEAGIAQVDAREKVILLTEAPQSAPAWNEASLLSKVFRELGHFFFIEGAVAAER